MLITKKDGSNQPFDENKVLKTLKIRSEGLSGVNQDKIFKEFTKNIAEGISTSDLEKMLILSASSLAETHLDYDKLATRLFLQKIYKEVLGGTASDEERDSAHKHAFIHFIDSSPLLDDRMRNCFDLVRLSNALDLEQDKRFNFLGLTSIYEKLLIRDENGFVKETPQMFFMRVAMGLCLEDVDDFVLDLYGIYSRHEAISSTPTLFASGLKKAQLSSCAGGVVTDTTESIFGTAEDSFNLGKWSYGIGTSVSKLRAIGSTVKSTRIQSSGIIPFLQIYNAICNSVNRGGRKRGAMCFYLENWHYETEDFIKLRRNSGDERMRTHDLNTALFISDEFMKRVMRDEQWMLIDPKEAIDNGYDLTELSGRAFSQAYKELENLAKAGKIKLFKFIKAKDLWKQQLLSLFETGHPWVTFKDAMNVRNPNQNSGNIYSSNLCTEIAQNVLPDASGAGEYFNCFLASANLGEMFHPETQFDVEKLTHAVRILVRALDNANDLNYYPTEGVRAGSQRYRSIGVGVMGWQDLLFKNKIPFDSPEAVDLLDRVAEVWSYAAIDASAALAVERGSYQNFEGSLWSQGILPVDTLAMLSESRDLPLTVESTTRLDWDVLREKVKKGMRNGYVMSPAPNASTALYLGVYPATEAQYANMYSKENMLGKFSIINEYLVDDLAKLEGIDVEEVVQKIKNSRGDLAKAGIKDEKILELYRNAFEVDPLAQVEQAKVLAKWIDQSHSRNIFLDTNSGKVLNDVYLQGWLGGVKTFYYLRSKAATSAENSTE